MGVRHEISQTRRRGRYRFASGPDRTEASMASLPAPGIIAKESGGNRQEINMSVRRLAIAAVAVAAFAGPAVAEDNIKLAVPQRGAWDTSIPDVGQKAGIFAKHGIKMEMLYTAGAGETTQAVISGSVDIGMGTGTSGIMATFSKGAPVRPFSSQMTGADDIFWYVPSNSPIKTLADADGKTMAFSSNGSSSNLGALALIKQSGKSIKAVAAGSPPATFTQTMSSQIDIGWSAPPYVIDDVKSGRVRIVARESDLEAFKNQTVRMNFATIDTLTKKADMIKRFLVAYKETIDYLYSDDPAALKTYADFAEITVEKAKLIRDEFFPKNNLSPTRISGLENAMADALALKFINAPFTKEQMDDFLKYYAK
jgi:NitT/TauT family transport system substrate-binding protein